MASLPRLPLGESGVEVSEVVLGVEWEEVDHHGMQDVDVLECSDRHPLIQDLLDHLPSSLGIHDLWLDQTQIVLPALGSVGQVGAHVVLCREEEGDFSLG